MAAKVMEDFEETERLLTDAEFLDARQLWYSSNYVYLCQMCAPTGEQFAAVYKPLRGENPLWDFPDGELYKREVAAYRLSRMLDWAMVPPTVVRTGPHGVGSLQLYIQHDPEAHFFVQRDVDELLPQLKRMCVFDVIANNADRKGGHCLLDEHANIWGIDHGLCFHSQYKLRSVIWDWVDEAVDPKLLDDIRRVGKAIGNEDASADELRALLSAGEPEAMLARIERLCAAGRFPQPGANRHYPWPLV
jgi:hypothetical protein